VLRVVESRDASSIASIYAPYVEQTAITFEYVAPSAEEMESRIAKVSAAYPWIVAEEEGEVLGYAYASRYRERAAYRWSLETSIYVREDRRGRGLGRSLYGALIPILRDLGIVTLYGAVTLPNPQSVALHARFGFRPLCTYDRVGFKMGAWRDVGWMVLRLREQGDETAADGGAPAEPVPFPDYVRSRPDSLRRWLDQSPRSRA